MANEIAQINLEEIRADAIKRSGNYKKRENFNDEDKKAIELFYLVEKGKALHEAISMIEAEEYVNNNKEEIEKERKKEEKAIRKKQKEEAEKRDKAIEKQVNKLVKIRKLFLKEASNVEKHISSTLNDVLPDGSEFSIGISSELETPSFLIDCSIPVKGKRRESVFTRIPFGDNLINCYNDKNAKKDIKLFNEAVDNAINSIKERINKVQKKASPKTA